MDDHAKNTDTRYLLAALIEIYRGQEVFLPETDPEAERQLLLDVFSTAISFARFEESRRTLSDEIYSCTRGGATIRNQIELARIQTPDVLNAKMVAAAHLIKIMDGGKFRFS
ncbi:MAG: hypothetical protein K6T66_08895 [Peptococcaceae bacterium]|nr:hypothetical protein [Peptococcaceae bacterium]